MPTNRTMRKRSIGGLRVGRGSPAPVPIPLAAMDEAEAVPHMTAMIGDTSFDGATARDADDGTAHLPELRA